MLRGAQGGCPSSEERGCPRTQELNESVHHAQRSTAVPGPQELNVSVPHAHGGCPKLRGARLSQGHKSSMCQAGQAEQEEVIADIEELEDDS